MLLTGDSGTAFAALLSLGIGVIILIIVITLVLQTIFLGLGLKAVGSNEREFGKVFVTVLLNILLGGLLGLIPIVGWIISLIVIWYLIKTRHDITFGQAILAWLISIIVPIIVVIIILFATGFWATLMAALMGSMTTP